MILKGFSEDMLKNVILQAESLIQSKGDKEDDKGDRVFQTEIQKSILEINSKLSQEPEVKGVEVDFDLISWQDYLLGSVDLEQLASRKEEILGNIQISRRRKKDRKEPEQFLKEAIQQIREELA